MANITPWSDAALHIPVDCSREALEQIRLASIEGLMALPRFGMGVGGLLLGTRQPGLIKLLDSVPIPCAHATGPSFVLTDQEIEHTRGLIQMASPLAVIGWYCSKTKGLMALTESDQNLFRALCPEPWQVCLLIRPSIVQPTKAAFCFRDRSGNVVQGTERELQPWAGDSLPAATQPQRVSPAAVTAVKAAAASGGELIDVVPETAVKSGPQTPAAQPVHHTAKEPAPVFSREPLPEPIPEPPARTAPQPPPARNNKRVSWAAALVIFGLCTVAFFMRDSLVPRPQLKLDVSDSNGHLTIRWNSEAVAGINQGVMSVDDGGQLHTIPLDNAELGAGMMGYDRTSERVTATMKAGDARALISFLAPAKPAASPHP